jgi:hypothetical protein
MALIGDSKVVFLDEPTSGTLKDKIYIFQEWIPTQGGRFGIYWKKLNVKEEQLY